MNVTEKQHPSEIQQCDNYRNNDQGSGEQTAEHVLMETLR